MDFAVLHLLAGVVALLAVPAAPFSADLTDWHRGPSAHATPYAARPRSPPRDYTLELAKDVGLGFFYYDRPAYRIEQAIDCWQKVFAFVKKHLSA